MASNHKDLVLPDPTEANVYQEIFRKTPFGKILLQCVDCKTLHILDANDVAQTKQFKDQGHKAKSLIDIFEDLRESGLGDLCIQALESGKALRVDEQCYGDVALKLQMVFKINLTPLNDTLIVIAFEDKTEKNRIELEKQQVLERLLRTNEELEKFAYVASHDLKSPLRAIDNLAHWILEDVGDALPLESQRHLALMQERVGRLETLLDDLLHYSRAGRYQYPIKQVAVSELVQQCIDSLPNPLEINFHIAPDLPTFNTMAPPLLQVFQNLIDNATKYHNKHNGQIEIGWEDRGTFCAFWVLDDGPGIAPMFHEKIFQMFQKLESRDKVEGTGIGLAVVKKTVESYGGQIRLDSTEGKGATFTFTWPKHLNEEVINENAGSQHSVGGRR